jgi:hypothetical protein
MTLLYEWEDLVECFLNGKTPKSVFPWYNEILPSTSPDNNLTYTNISSIRSFVEDARKNIFKWGKEAVNQEDKTLCVSEDVNITEEEASYAYHMITYLECSFKYTTDRYGSGTGKKDDPTLSYRSLSIKEHKNDPSNIFTDNLLPNLLIYRRVEYLLMTDDKKETEDNDWMELFNKLKGRGAVKQTIERMLYREFYPCVPDYFIKGLLLFERQEPHTYYMLLSKAQLYEYVVCDVWYNEPREVIFRRFLYIVNVYDASSEHYLRHALQPKTRQSG